MERHMSGNGRGGPDLGRYSLSRAIAAAAEGRLDGFEREMSDELARTMGRRPQGFFIPNEVLARTCRNERDGLMLALMAQTPCQRSAERLARGPAPAARRCRGRGNRSFWTCRQHRHSNRSAATAASWTTETGTLSEQTPAVDQLIDEPQTSWSVQRDFAANSSPKRAAPLTPSCVAIC